MLSALVEFLFPRRCLACGAPPTGPAHVCDDCRRACAPLPAPWCPRCGHPRRAGCRCPVCPALPALIRWGRSACWATDPVPRALVHALKYEGWPVVARVLGARMAALGPPDVPDGRRGVLVPVPLSAARRRSRGFNQCERLAGAMAAVWGWPVREDLIARVRDAPPQARLHAAERRTNIHGCFAPCDGARARRLHPVLVDDVLTTGATLAECADALQGAGADSVSFLTFGRARSPGER